MNVYQVMATRHETKIETLTVSVQAHSFEEATEKGWDLIEQGHGTVVDTDYDADDLVHVNTSFLCRVGLHEDQHS